MEGGALESVFDMDGNGYSIPDQLCSQLQTELLQGHLPCSTKVLQKDEAVRDGDVNSTRIY